MSDVAGNLINEEENTNLGQIDVDSLLLSNPFNKDCSSLGTGCSYLVRKESDLDLSLTVRSCTDRTFHRTSLDPKFIESLETNGPLVSLDIDCSFNAKKTHSYST